LKAVLLRVQRDERWIDEMLFWLESFKRLYVDTRTVPPPNFFWDSPNSTIRARYRRFLAMTQGIGGKQSVEVIHHVQHERIQRVMGKIQCAHRSNDRLLDFTSLFLDNLAGPPKCM
jgi:hypothetical protein